jgi:hypothetical protein
MSAETTAYIIDQLHALVRRKGLALNSKKQSVARASQRQVATKLVVNRKTSLPSEQRSSIRGAVRALRKTPAVAFGTQRYGRTYRRVSGLVTYLSQHHPAEAAHLRTILRGLPAPPRRSPKVR